VHAKSTIWHWRMDQSAASDRPDRMRSLRHFDDLCSDLNFAVRALRVNAGFALVSSLTIAVAIAGNSMIFGVVRGIRRSWTFSVSFRSR
jgi:hypothetical protein